ncbi:thiamine-phosphate kinase [Methylovirgula sp. 4M-Z18]|uniref:thiamine-phosphate kinase n=1 Tax=Methylovirgula sp. 4M-Z18 TaxID=2293567 RepID=UPI001FE0E011|nr:thiamine-phosphate kinase [Methylovirgula sp. 4M-Z18]
MSLSEDDLIAKYFAPIAGPGSLDLRDDAALLKPPAGHDVILTTDALVAGVHFFADDPPEKIARKALRVNLSDLAAKAGEPTGFLLTLALPPDWTEEWLAGFARGLAEDSADFKFPLLGGDTVRTPGPLTISVTALGYALRGWIVPRTGAKPGDKIYVTGTIGDAALGVRVRQKAEADRAWIDALPLEFCAHLLDRYLLPQPRVGLRKVLRAEAHGGMDVSDGLIGDVTKMMKASGTGGRIELARIPLSPAVRAAIASDGDLFEAVITGGDDYEVLAAVAPTRAAAFESSARAAGIAVTQIGEVLEAGAVTCVESNGRVRVFAQKSFSHF